MIEQNDTATRSEERALLLSQIRRGQILEHAELSEEALKIWLHTLDEAKIMVQDCRTQLNAEIERLGLTEDQGLNGKGADAEEATATKTGPHRQRLRSAIEIEHSKKISNLSFFRKSVLSCLYSRLTLTLVIFQCAPSSLRMLTSK